MADRRLVLRSVLAALAMAAVLVLAGCGGAPSGGAASPGIDAAGPGESGGAPTLEIVQPLEGATVKPGDVPVKVKVANLKLVPGGSANIAGQGHVHYTLDGNLIMKPADTVTFPGVRAGEHTLVVELAGNDHASLTPPVGQTVKFKAQ